MDLLLSPLAILLSNLVAALVFAIVKDVLNNALRGETQLILEKLAITADPGRAETPHVAISGRRAGLIGHFLTLFDLGPQVSLTANAREVRKSSTSFHGQSVELIPVSEGVSIQVESRRSAFWLLAALLSLTAGAGSGLLAGENVTGSVVNALAWVLSAGIYLVAYYQSHRFEIHVHGSLRAGVSFKPGLADGRSVQFPEVLEAVEMLMERIHESRSPGRGSVVTPAAHSPAPLGGSWSARPALSALSDSAEAFPDPDETITEPFPAKASALASANRTEHANTGTVEFGEDQPRFEPPFWSGPEPGTSDSIQLRQSISRSETGLFLGGPANVSEYDEEVLEDRETDSNIGSHRGTVAWEEHADKTQDEVRAETELADLRRSRPKRGEAKQRLRELMRRFPMTDAADKARRMLERLESGG